MKNEVFISKVSYKALSLALALSFFSTIAKARIVQYNDEKGVELYRAIVEEKEIVNSSSIDAEIARLKAIKAEHTAKQDYVQTLIDTQEALKARFEGTIDEIVIVIPSTIN